MCRTVCCSCRRDADGIDQGVLNALVHAPSQRVKLGPNTRLLLQVSASPPPAARMRSRGPATHSGAKVFRLYATRFHLSAAGPS